MEKTLGSADSTAAEQLFPGNGRLPAVSPVGERISGRRGLGVLAGSKHLAEHYTVLLHDDRHGKEAL
jgi:hypothetical protein